MRKHLLPIVLCGLLVVATIVALLGSLGALTPSSGAQFADPAVATAERPAAFPGMAVAFTGSGTFRVPDQAPPGEYAITSTSGVFGCSWWVLKVNDGKPKSEISSGTITRSGFDSFTIPDSARWLKLLGTCTISLAEGSP